MLGSEDGGPVGVEHVHGELVLHSTRNALERATRAMRDLHLIGHLNHDQHPARTLGIVHVTLATDGRRALLAEADGFTPGPTLEELAATLRSALASSVILQDCSGGELAATVPPLIAERMTKAASEPAKIRHVYVLPPGVNTDESDIETWAMSVGGPTTLVRLGDRDVLVGLPNRPSAFAMKDQRPLVQLVALEDQVIVQLWSRHNLRWSQGPRKRLVAQSQPDVALAWAKEPIRLVGDMAGGPSQPPRYDAARSLEHRMITPPAREVPPGLARGVERVATELRLEPSAVPDLLDLAIGAWAPDLAARAAAALRLPPDAVGLADGTIDPMSLAGATTAAPSGLVQRALERKFRR
ncbi:hypothetical protein [Occultella kanbiaonis]|uniref:hypothetical protein n=1 Tax=Occultella kanbiaonis TaxID=2675754 RepID=UPI0013D15F9B|nr:hypothetical protein [Occultella kanbiaonis]